MHNNDAGLAFSNHSRSDDQSVFDRGTLRMHSNDAGLGFSNHSQSDDQSVFGKGIISMHSIGAASSSWSSGLCILVVDDSGANRKVLKRTLGMHGHTIHVACDGLEFLDVMQKSNERLSQLGGSMNERTTDDGFTSHREFDVVLMDYFMPRMDGSEATKAIRARGYRGLIVGLTGHTLAADVEHFKDSGVDVVLSKPLKLDALIEVVATYLDKQCKETDTDTPGF